MELNVCLGFKISVEIRSSMDLFICHRKVRGIVKTFASNSVDKTAFENRITYDTANSYVNHFLRTGNCLPRKHGGANYVVVIDWIQAYIESLFLCNTMLSIYRKSAKPAAKETRMTYIQLQPHKVLSISAICLCIQRLNFTFKKFTVANLFLLRKLRKH